MKTSISYFISHPIQYFSPLFQALSKEFDLTVYYLSDATIKGNVDKGFGQPVKWDTPLLEGYRYKFIRNISWRQSLSNRFLDLINPGVVSALLRDPSKVVIVNGWSYSSILVTILFAKMAGKQVWMRAENPHNQEISQSGLKKVLKKLFLQYSLFKLIDRFLYIGTQNKQFYLYYGVDLHKLIYSPYCVDNNFFSNQYIRLRGHRSELRQRHQLPDQSVVILFSGKYIPKKRPLDLLKAYANLINMPVALVMVGEGELREPMEAYIDQHRLKNVILTGFVNQGEISNYYSLADIFVLPSGRGETWGLVVNEAMLFNLPVVTTHTAGCSIDLVQPGINGFIYNEGSVDQLTESLSTLIRDKELRLKAGLESGRIIGNYTYKVMIENMRAELEK